MSQLDYLKVQHVMGKMSRREFMGRAAALGASSAMISTMISETQAAETPKKGGTLRLGLGGGSTTDSLELGSYNDSVMIDASHSICNGLVEWGQDGKPIPDLAETLEPKNGAATWVLKLRKGVKFHNGKEFDADDAIYSLNLHRGEGSKSGGASQLKPIKDIKKVNANEIEITLDSGDVDFPYALTDYHILMVPDGFKDWTTLIGTGAYALTKFEPGVRISMKRNPDYYKPNRGHVDAVEITVINDASARLNALISGQVDAINRTDPKSVSKLQANAKFAIVRATSGYFVDMAATTDKAPFNNPDLILALKHAMNREQMLKTLFAGYGAIGNDHPISQTDPYFNKDLPQLKHDPDLAKFHFKKAGMADAKIILQASDAAFNGAVDMASLLQSDCDKAGFKMEVKKEPADGWWANVWLKAPFVTSYWGGRAAATQMLAVAYQRGAAWNESHWSNDKFEKLLVDARSEANDEKRKTYIWEMQALLRDSSGALIPAFRDWLDAHNDKVGGMAPHGGFDMGNGLVAEKVWMKG